MDFRHLWINQRREESSLSIYSLHTHTRRLSVSITYIVDLHTAALYGSMWQHMAAMSVGMFSPYRADVDGSVGRGQPVAMCSASQLRGLKTSELCSSGTHFVERGKEP